MKALLKKHIPWAIRESLRSSRHFLTHSKPAFRGIYKSFDDLPKTAVYDHQDWGNNTYLKAMAAKRLIGSAVPPQMAPSKSLLPAVVSAMLPSTTGKDTGLKILDFGGGGGVDYGHLRAMTGDKCPQLSYHVVDLPPSCDAGRRAWSDDGRITFSTDLPPLTERFDLVYSYSSVHCVPDYKGLLKRLAGYGASLMLFCKHPAHEGPAFVREQLNMGHGKEVPQWVLSIPEIENILSSQGYKLLFRAPGENIYNVNNYTPPHRVEGVLNMIFART